MTVVYGHFHLLASFRTAATQFLIVYKLISVRACVCANVCVCARANVHVFVRAGVCHMHAFVCYQYCIFFSVLLKCTVGMSLCFANLLLPNFK